MTNPTGKGGFQERKHQINRLGRPKSFDKLRALAQYIAHEPTSVIINGKAVTVTEAILRQWAQSKNPQLQRAFIEIAFGKVPDEFKHMGADGRELVLKIIYDREIGYDAEAADTDAEAEPN